MKKLLFAAMAATGLLASCGGLGGVTGPSADVTGVTFSSEHTLDHAVLGSDGVTYAKGTSVICDNWDTDIDALVSYSGSVSKVNLQLQGSGGGYTDIYAYPVNVLDTDGLIDVTYTIKAGMAPQSIVVTPVPVNVTEIKRYTRVAAYVNGNTRDVVYSNVIPVVNCSL